MMTFCVLPPAPRRQGSARPWHAGTASASSEPLGGPRRPRWGKPWRRGKSGCGWPAHVALRRTDSPDCPAAAAAAAARFRPGSRTRRSSSCSVGVRTSSAAAGRSSRSAPGETGSTGTFLPGQRPGNRGNRCWASPCRSRSLVGPRRWLRRSARRQEVRFPLLAVG